MTVFWLPEIRPEPPFPTRSKKMVADEAGRTVKATTMRKERDFFMTIANPACNSRKVEKMKGQDIWLLDFIRARESWLAVLEDHTGRKEWHFRTSGAGIDSRLSVPAIETHSR